MDAGSEAVDLMVREGLQITEASIKLLAAGSKNLAAFIYALAKDNKRVSGRTNMGRLLREGKELRVFQLRESDLAAFHAYAKKGVLYAVVKDKNARDGLVDLITNVDFAAQVNLFLERHGYLRPVYLRQGLHAGGCLYPGCQGCDEAGEQPHSKHYAQERPAE